MPDEHASDIDETLAIFFIEYRFLDEKFHLSSFLERILRFIFKHFFFLLRNLHFFEFVFFMFERYHESLMHFEVFVKLIIKI